MSNPLLDIFEGAGDLTPMPWPNEHAEKGYIICFTGRCGSTELVDALGQTNACGKPDEYFNEEFVPHHNLQWQANTLAEYVKLLVEYRSSGRIFGFKVDGFRHRRLCEITPPELLFPRRAFRYFYMTRRDLCEQAFSFAHAKATGVWHVRDSSETRTESNNEYVHVSDKDIWKEIALILEQEFYFERYFVESRIVPFRLDYEMLCASKASLIADMFLELDLPRGTIKSAIKGIRPNLRKLEYAESRQGRIVDFRDRYRSQLPYLTLNRGRLPYASVRNFLAAETSIDIAGT